MNAFRTYGEPGVLPRVYSSGAVELLKWTALLAMVVDHLNAVFLARHGGLPAEILGRLAMPIFSVVLAYNLARPGVDVQRALQRLALVGCIATPAFALLFSWVGVWPLNVMFTFTVAAAVIAAITQGKRTQAVVIFVVASCLVEYFHAGVGLVLASWAYFRGYDRRGWLVVIAMAALCVFNGNVWALLALPVLSIAAYADVRVPRLRWAFYAFYPAHLAVLVLLSTAG